MNKPLTKMTPVRLVLSAINDKHLDEFDSRPLSDSCAWLVAHGLARRIGLRSYQAKKDHKGFQYDGRGRIWASSASDLVHECAHFLVASPKHRYKAEYGLGTGPELWSSCQALVNSEKADSDEGLASLFGIIWEAELRMGYAETIVKHSWDCNPDPGPDLVIRRLRRLKLFVHGHPVIPSDSRYKQQDQPKEVVPPR